MATGNERYLKHPVWETLRLKRDMLNEARFGDANAEQWRTDIVEWLDEAAKTRATRQPALYLSVLDPLSNMLNQIPFDLSSFQQFVSPSSYHNGQGARALEVALRELPLPAPKDLKTTYVNLLDQEVAARTERLTVLETRITETEESLAQRLTELTELSEDVKILQATIEAEKTKIADVTVTAEEAMRHAWEEELSIWQRKRRETDAQHDAEALANIATLAATAKSGEVNRPGFVGGS